jgi:hypothetical protein
MHPASVTPGVVPFIDTLSALVTIPGAGGPLMPIGVMVQGDVTFTQAGVAAADPIEATASGQILDVVVVETP